jgi:hypothetical protein
MKTKMSKRVLTFVLAIVLTFALGVSAFATWSSFQGRNTNNGTTNSAPTSATPTRTKVNLSFNSAFSGVDTTPVIQGNYAYILYNGGAVDTSTGAGGARLARVDITSMDPNTATIWDCQLDADANNAQQLSTPYYDSSTNTIYAGVTLDSNILAGKTLSDWNSTAISGGTLTIPANTTVTLIYEGLTIPGAYGQAYFMTGITPASGSGMSGTVTLEDTNSGATYAYGTSYSYAGYEFGLYNNSGMTVPAGNYDVIITLTSDAAVSSTAPITCTVSNWRLYKVTSLSASVPTFTKVADGAGQINTHINAGGGYLYFGISEGDRCYWQFDPSDNSKISFKPTGGEDFYWAGAAKVGNYMIFGSESGKVYRRPIGATFGSASGTSIDLNNYVTDPGAVRSSICFDDQPGADNDALYLTTNGGYLWKLNTALTTAANVRIYDTTYAITTTSTPVVSANRQIYVGGYKTTYNSATYTTEYAGEVWKVPVNSFNQSALQSLWVSNSEAVQSSIVAYSTTNPSTGVPIDYLYFTTNGASGKGYCLSYAPGSVSSAAVWTTGSVGTGYTLQGVAVSDNGIVVFGNDDNELYIVK